MEAIETPVEALFEAGKMKKLISDVDALTERINALKEPKYKAVSRKFRYLSEKTSSGT